MTTQTLSGISLTDILPGMDEILTSVLIGVGIFAIISTIYFGIGMMIAHSRGSFGLAEESGTFNLHIGFITAISTPLMLLATAGIPGLMIGALIGAVIAIAATWAGGRQRAHRTVKPTADH